MSEKCPVCNNIVSEQDEACPVCGFKFLGSTQSFQPLTLSGEEVVAKPLKTPKSAVLRVIRGPQTEMVYALEGEIYTIGRSPKCDIFLNDMTVSRLHAEILRTENGYVIKDLNSYNGVWINNQNCEEAVLKSSDILQIGSFCLLYEEDHSSKTNS